MSNDLMLHNPNALHNLLHSPDSGPDFPPAQWLAVMQRQTALYTRMESSSVPAETAEELFLSVKFCVNSAVNASKGKLSKAPSTLAGWLLAGQRLLYQHTQGALHLQAAAEMACLPLENPVYQDALAQTRSFFKWYDIRFMAHQIPGMLDYPLAQPVDEALLGVDYMAEWLRRRLWEDTLCAMFPPAQVQAVLRRHSASWRHLPLNLFEPVLLCAVGRALLHLPADALSLTPAQAQALWALCSPCNIATLKSLLGRAAARLCNELHIWPTAQRQYYALCAVACAPQLLAAEKHYFTRLFL